MTIAQLNRLSAAEKIWRLYFFYGTEPFLSSFYSRRLCNNLNNIYGMSDFNFAELEGDRTDVPQICRLVESVPVFAYGKCVYIKNYCFDMLSKDDTQLIIDALTNMPETTTVVITTSDINAIPDNKKWSALFDLTERIGMKVECNTPTRQELIGWIQSAVKRSNASITSQTAEYLIDFSGLDMVRLRSEIPKLAAYADGEILPAHIERIGTKQIDVKVFDMVNCITERQFARSYELLDELFETEDIDMIFGAISSVFADIYRAKIAFTDGKTISDIAADFGYKGKEFRIKNAIREARKFSENSLNRCIAVIADADYKLKRSVMDKKTVFECMIATIQL